MPSTSKSTYERVFVNEDKPTQKLIVEEHGAEPGTSRIYVYQPTIYSVGARPALILTPALKCPLATGYISQSRPHSMNHIMVGDLGNEEILLLSTDSGNVAAYRTERIFRVIEESREEECRKPEELGATVPCFFTDWVGRSAWGLAIHKFARLIAVSANTSDITVWAFALADTAGSGQKGLESDKHPYMTDWLDVTEEAQFKHFGQLTPRQRRSRNIRLTLSGHPSNIPCISFLNSELDPHGEWLVSTDVTNRLFLWKIWTRSFAICEWNLNPLWPVGDGSYMAEPYERGWSVLALDPRSFRLKSSIEEACGGNDLWNEDRDAYDLTPLVDHVPNASTRYCGHSDFRDELQQSANSPTPDSHFSGDSDEEGGQGPIVADGGIDLAEGYADSESEDEDNAETTVSNNLLHEGNSQALVANNDFGSQPDGQLNPESSGESGIVEEAVDLNNLLALDEAHELSDAEQDENMSEAEEQTMSEDNAPFRPLSPLQRLLEQDSSSSDSANEDDVNHVKGPRRKSVMRKRRVEFPILHFTETDAQLMWVQDDHLPSVICRKLLRQTIPQFAPALMNRDRFNMVHQIPELGVVIAGSQIGRVAILSLTEVPDVGRFMRIDHIVPFASQEERGMRPLLPLVGVAVGPVESNLIPVEDSNSDDDLGGFSASNEDGGDGPKVGKNSTNAHKRPHRARRQAPRESWHGAQYSRRYRLILMYLDHTVLRYELFYDWPKSVVGVRHDETGPFTLGLST
ncbi:hypothetical protein PRK78_006995 [Emydomyces testavorans]|uniref:Uncharacterized protein n=1 Tax=Emydomyces testavorans TaxID=2070801 RepID=A0AAF0DR87_9EURO|nr:hypothetical protein PRK78_006995 [Emydomyces testavorans]